MSFAFTKTPCISVSCTLISVQKREYELDLQDMETSYRPGSKLQAKKGISINNVAAKLKVKTMSIASSQATKEKTWLTRAIVLNFFFIFAQWNSKFRV